MNVTTASPAEIDARIAELNGRIENHEQAIMRAEQQAEKLAKVLANGNERQLLVAGGRDQIRREINAVEADLPAKYEARDKLAAERAPFTAEYTRRGGWARYFVVDNNNGHLHTTTACQNTYFTTSWVWMTGMSGMTRAEAVEEGGSLTCLTCFGEFREVIESGREPRFETPRMKRTREEREALAAKKAEKARKAAAEAITNPDGTPVLDSLGYEIKRDAKVQSEYVEEASSALFFADSTNVFRGSIELDEHKAMCARRAAISAEHAARYLAALAHKAGVTTEEKAAELDKKVQAKLRATIRGAAAEAARLGFAY